MNETRKPLRSQPARDRILAEARSVFASQGYERATIRAIAAAAKVNPAMVIRYYGCKEDLFAVAARFDLQLPDLSQAPRECAGELLVAHFLSRWEDGTGGGDLAVLLRAAATHDTARATMALIFEKQLTLAVTQWCGAANARQRASLVASQMLGLAYTRYVLGFAATKLLPRATIVKMVGRTIQAYLDDPFR
jgi:AcrR family transcriptional regulator